MTYNKNVKFRFLTNFLNTWNPNHAQEPKTYTNKTENQSKFKTTLFYQNQSQIYWLNTQ